MFPDSDFLQLEIFCILYLVQYFEIKFYFLWFTKSVFVSFTLHYFQFISWFAECEFNILMINVLTSLGGSLLWFKSLTGWARVPPMLGQALVTGRSKRARNILHLQSFSPTVEDEVSRALVFSLSSHHFKMSFVIYFIPKLKLIKLKHSGL